MTDDSAPGAPEDEAQPSAGPEARDADDTVRRRDPPGLVGTGNEPPDGGSGGRSRAARIAIWVTIIGGILGAIVAALTIYLFVSPPSHCDELGGDLEDASIDRDMTYREYLRITNQHDPTAGQELLDRRGTLVAMRIAASGFEGRELPLRWTTFTEDGHLTEDGLTDQLALGLVPEQCTDTILRKLWVRWPKAKGTYLVEVTLLDDREGVLDTARTPPFDVPNH